MLKQKAQATTLIATLPQLPLLHPGHFDLDFKEICAAQRIKPANIVLITGGAVSAERTLSILFHGEEATPRERAALLEAIDLEEKGGCQDEKLDSKVVD